MRFIRPGPEAPFKAHPFAISPHSHADVIVLLSVRISFQAKNLKICITAGVGSDHIDLNAAVDKGIQVLEVSLGKPFNHPFRCLNALSPS